MKVNQKPKEKQTVFTKQSYQFSKFRNEEERVIWGLKVTLEEYFFPKTKTQDNQKHTKLKTWAFGSFKMPIVVLITTAGSKNPR